MLLGLGTIIPTSLVSAARQTKKGILLSVLGEIGGNLLLIADFGKGLELSGTLSLAKMCSDKIPFTTVARIFSCVSCAFLFFWSESFSAIFASTTLGSSLIRVLSLNNGGNCTSSVSFQALIVMTSTSVLCHILM